jgi:hypothetical protein
MAALTAKTRQKKKRKKRDGCGNREPNTDIAKKYQKKDAKNGIDYQQLDKNDEKITKKTSQNICHIKIKLYLCNALRQCAVSSVGRAIDS